MMASETVAPFHLLERLAARRASGELICVGSSSESEVHVYLQAGRLAWATDSLHPQEFTRHLKRITSLSDEGFVTVLEECRRRRLPIGETLVEWKLATYEQVRGSLRHQIESALRVLRAEPVAQTVFLERTQQYARYRSDLTFALDELLPELPPETTTRHASEPLAGSTLVSQLREANDFGWVELLEGRRVRAQAPLVEGEASRVPEALIASTLLDDAALAALRSPHGSIVGVTLPAKNRSLWCFVPSDSAFGSAVSTLGVLAMEPMRSSRKIPIKGELLSWGDSSDEVELVREFLQRAPEARGAVICLASGEPIVGVVRTGLERRWATGIVRRRGPALRCEMPHEVGSNELENLGFRLKSLATAEEDAWCFGAELAPPGDRTLWLFVDRGSPQGLGWAYMTTLSRQLSSGEAG
jgi:hypothetical protein